MSKTNFEAIATDAQGLGRFLRGGNVKRKQRQFAAVLSLVIVAIPFAAFMPWNGTNAAEEMPRSSAEPSSIISPSPILTLAPEEEEPEYIPDAAEVEALAKMLYGEARGITSDMEKAACVWCVLNRVDDPRFPDTVLEVLEAPYQFAGYSADYPVLPELATLAADVLIRYQAERDGETNVGRVLPAEYLYFTGDGRNNHFTIGWKDVETWDWSLQNPYDD